MRWCSKFFAIMTLQLKIRSVVYSPVPKLASPSLGGWSSLWYCSIGIAWGFPSLVVVSLVICSTPLHLFCSQIFWHRAVSAFTVRSTTLLISSEGMSSIPGYLPVFTAASTSPSVPADCPHFQWRTGWFVVWSRRCRDHCCTCHRTSMPTSSAIHHCPWSAYYLYHRWQLLLLVGFGDIIVCIVAS